MKKSSAVKLAFVLLTLAPCAHAQAPAPSATAKEGGAATTRVRRATSPANKQTEPSSAGDTQAGAPQDATKNPPPPSGSLFGAPAADGATRATSAGAPKAEAVKDEATKVEAVKAEAAKADAPAAEDPNAWLEMLRERIASEKSSTERARLQRELVERLSAVGRQTEAVVALRAMLTEERFDPPFFYNVGNALARFGESHAAVEAYRKAVAQRRGNYARALHNLGVVLMRLGRWEEARESLWSALRLENFTYAEASYSLGRLHALRGEAGLAIAEWERTLRLKPEHADATIALARALAEDGDPEQALAVLDAFGKRLARRGANAPREIEVARGEIVAAANVPRERARAGARIEAGDDADRSEVRRASVAAAAREADPLAFPREARRPPPLRPLSVKFKTYDFLRRARAAREAERHEEAVALYRESIESRGGYFPPANLELGYALAALHRDLEAVASLRPVIERDGARYPIAFYHLGRFYERLGELERAGEAFTRVAALIGDESPQFFVDISRVRERQGRWTDALAAAESYVRALERLGGVPDWARERVNELRHKVSTAGATK